LWGFEGVLQVMRNQSLNLEESVCSRETPCNPHNPPAREPAAGANVQGAAAADEATTQ
jgi:hypothetical protein